MSTTPPPIIRAHRLTSGEQLRRLAVCADALGISVAELHAAVAYCTGEADTFVAAPERPRAWQPCRACGATGIVWDGPAAANRECAVCDGLGEVPV